MYMSKQSLTEQLVAAIETQAEREARQANEQQEKVTQRLIQERAMRDAKLVKYKNEISALSGIFAAVSDQDIVKALKANNSIQVKTWKNWTVLHSDADVALDEILDSEGGRALKERLKEVSAKVSSVAFERLRFSDDNLENLFLRNKMRINLDWQKDDFKQMAQQKKLQNTM